LAAAVAGRPGLRLVVETSGLGWSEHDLAEMADRAGRSCSWIVSLDAATQRSYRRLRGDGFEEALACIDRLMRLFPETTHVQAVRMNENEEELEGFFRAWKERTERVIIQKYDFFSGFLDQRKVTDLSPLRRFPCWHLKRDLVIRLDGSVPPCREDLQARHTLGNVFSDGLAAVWERGSAWYADHCSGTYPELCGNCDEYYTFNF
jgi:spiro-SPASM protein